MSRDPSHIFLSGSTADFEQVRLDLDKALRRGRCHVTHQDSFPQTVSDTLLKLAELIEPCGMMIHMIGQEPGSIPTPDIRAQYLSLVETNGKFLTHSPHLRSSLGDFSTITYTQWEAYIAFHLGMPLLVYADKEHASPTHPQRAHLDRLKEVTRYASSFDDHAGLHRMIMADLMAHFRQNPATSDIPAVLKPSNLPGGYIGRIFIGREEFLETLCQSLYGTTHATAITQKPAATGISGLGGIGKTHAAIEYAHRHRDDYNALLFASADSPEKLQSSLAALCDVLHLDEKGNLPPDEPVRVRAALDWLASHSGWLLILDNADDEPAAKAVQEILGHIANGHVLITSRLHGWSDQVKNLDLEVLSEAAAAELILQLTATHRRLAPDDETQARQLAELLDGLPLAIHQAAGYINEQTLTLAEYIARYQKEAAQLLNWFDDLRIPYERPEKLAPRPVLITWKTSFDQLGESDRFWLLVFSQFSSDPIPEFLLEPTEHATPEERGQLREASEAINHAEKYCLLTRSRNEPIFKLHRLVQQIIRLQSSDEKRHSAIDQGIALIHLAKPGNPLDVHNWPKWNRLQSHVVSICELSSDDPVHENLIWMLSQLGSLLHEKGVFEESKRCRLRALAIARIIYGDHHPIVAVQLNNLAQVLKTMNRFDEAEPLMVEGLRIARLAHGDDHPNVAIQLNNLAQLLKSTNQLSKAESLMREALRIDTAAYGPNNPNVAIRLTNLAALFHATDRLVEAEPLMREALRIDLATYGNDHPMVATDLNNLAQLLKATISLAEVEPLFWEALRIDRTAYGNDHPIVAIRLYNLAHLLEETSRQSEAEPLMREALRIDRAAYGGDHPNVARHLRSLGQLLYETNSLSEAELLMREALKIDYAASGENKDDIAHDLNNLAQLLLAMNRPAEAEPLMREALRIAHASLGPEHRNTMTVSRNLEVLLAAMGGGE